MVCDEVHECDDSVEVCEDDSQVDEHDGIMPPLLREVPNEMRRRDLVVEEMKSPLPPLTKGGKKCLTLNDLTLVVEMCQLLQTSIDENDDSLEICETFHEENDFHDEKIERENDQE